MSWLGSLSAKSVETAAGTALGIALVSFISYTFIGVTMFYSYKDDMEKETIKMEKLVTKFEDQRSVLEGQQKVLYTEITAMTTKRINELKAELDAEHHKTDEAILLLRKELETYFSIMKAVKSAQHRYDPKPDPVEQETVEEVKSESTRDWNEEFENFKFQKKIQQKLDESRIYQEQSQQKR